MKSMKLASGFAVSALALAIAGTATAQETETEFTYSGDVEVIFEMDFTAETNDARSEEYNLELDIDVVHGPFSGNMNLSEDDGVEIGDLVITDGPISFGQVGSLIETNEYTYDLENAATADVDAALRYTMNGLKVQIEGSDDAPAGDDYGIGASYSDSIDALSYIVNTQVRLSDSGAALDDDNEPFIFAGAGVTYTLDIATIAAAFNYYTVDGDAANTEDMQEVAVSLTTTPIDALELGFHFQDEDLGEDLGMKYKVDGSYEFAPITVSGYFEGTEVADDNDGTEFENEVQGKVEYSQDAIGAYGQVTMMLVDDANPEFELGASLTRENGVVYSSTYTFQDDDDDDAVTNMLVFSAAYGF